MHNSREYLFIIFYSARMKSVIYSRHSLTRLSQILDTLEQSAKPLVAEYLTRANVSRPPRFKNMHFRWKRTETLADRKSPSHLRLFRDTEEAEKCQPFHLRLESDDSVLAARSGNMSERSTAPKYVFLLHEYDYGTIKLIKASKESF